jgi:hypothetical protein
LGWVQTRPAARWGAWQAFLSANLGILFEESKATGSFSEDKFGSQVKLVLF